MRYTIKGLPPGSLLYLGGELGRFVPVATDGSFSAEPSEIPYLRNMGFDVQETTLTGEAPIDPTWFDPSAHPAIAANQVAAAEAAKQYATVPALAKKKK